MSLAFLKILGGPGPPMLSRIEINGFWRNNGCVCSQTKNNARAQREEVEFVYVKANKHVQNNRSPLHGRLILTSRTSLESLGRGALFSCILKHTLIPLFYTNCVSFHFIGYRRSCWPPTKYNETSIVF